MAINVKQPEINQPINTEVENKEKIETPVILRFNPDGKKAKDRWKFDGSGSLEEKEKDFKNFIDSHVLNNEEIPDRIEDFNSSDSLKDMARGDADVMRAYRQWYDDALERHSVKSFKDLNEKIKTGKAAADAKAAGTATKEEAKRVEMAKTGSTPAEVTVKKTEDGKKETVIADPLASKEERLEAAETAKEVIDEKKEEPKTEPEPAASLNEEEIKPIANIFDTFETYGLNVLTDDMSSQESEVKLNDLYGSLSKAERREIDKQISELAPTIQKAWKETKNKNANKLVKFFKSFADKRFSDPEKKEEWLRGNPTPITAIFGESGLNAGQRIGLALGLLAAMTSDTLAGYNAGLNHTTANPQATENFVKPFKEINAKNIERITKLKDASTNAEGEMEETVANFKQDNRLKAIPRSTLASLITFLQNPSNEINEETLGEYEEELQKAYENEFLGGSPLTSDTLTDYNKWKATTIKHLASKIGIDKERLDNANKFLDIAIKENQLAQQVHNFEFSSITDYNNAIQGLRAEELELQKLRSEAVASDTGKLLDIAGKYRNVVAGLSTTSGGETESESKGATAGSSSGVGGEIGGDVGIKKIANVHASAHGSYGKSKTETETSGKSKNTATYEDAANDEVYAWLNDGKLKGDLSEAKNTLINAIDAQIKAIQSTIKEMERMKSKSIKKVGFDDKLTNLYETGFYENPRIKNNDYYRYRLGLV